MLFFAFFRQAKKKMMAPVFQAGVTGVEKGRGKEAKERGDWGEKETGFSFALSHPLLPFFAPVQPSMQTFFWLVTQSYPRGKERWDEAQRTSARQASVCHQATEMCFGQTII